MVKELLITVFYFSGAFAAPFDSNGVNIIQPCTWYKPIQQATGVKVRIHKSYRRRHFAPELQRLEDWHKLSYRTFTYMRRQPAKGVRLGILPPLVDMSGIRYIAGLAEGGRCNPHGGIAVANVQETRSNGLSAVRASQVVITHELTHAAFGVKHNDSVPNIMHSQAGMLAYTQDLGFLDSTKAQMESCLGRNGFYKRKAK